MQALNPAAVHEESAPAEQPQPSARTQGGDLAFAVGKHEAHRDQGLGTSEQSRQSGRSQEQRRRGEHRGGQAQDEADCERSADCGGRHACSER
jgi:hypothetical protein